MWSSKHEDEMFMKERLDKALVNQEWATCYNNSQVESLVVRNYDHKPLLASCLKHSFQIEKRNQNYLDMKLVGKWMRIVLKQLNICEVKLILTVHHRQVFRIS